jgi:RNA polymerase sigma-70 factor, ECF subfamily
MLHIAKTPLSADEEFRAKLLELLPYLRAFARTLCGLRDGADDLAQEAIRTAWQNRAMFEPGTNMKAWLFTIQRNTYYSAHRRTWRQVGWDEDAMERRLVTSASQQSGVELTDLRRAMSMLPDEQREALILVGAGGFSYLEAAAICACAVGTMKSRVSRARQTLTAMMADGTRLPASNETAEGAYQGIMSEMETLSGKKRRRAG